MPGLHEVILRGMAGSLKSLDDAEIIGITERAMRVGLREYEEKGYDGLYDYRKGPTES